MEINVDILKKLQREHGEAFYLLDSMQFKANFEELRKIFSNIYSNFNIAYSYKTNYTPKFCKIVNELGGYAEVVSEMEAELALRIGVDPKKIIWNGPIKPPEMLEKLLLRGVTVNIDSIEECHEIKKIAKKNINSVLHVGIRCNFDVKDGGLSRFGLDIDGNDFLEVLDIVSDVENVKFMNLQCHFAKRDLRYWPIRTQGMLDLIDKIGFVPERIDLGGGLFGKMEDSLKQQFDIEIPSYEEYAKVSATLFAEYFQDAEKKPELILEPGSALVGDCMKFAGTVKTIKQVRGKTIASILGSQKNISMIGINPPMDIYAMGKAQKMYVDVDFVGFTCIESDVLYKDYSGKLAVGDMAVFGNCGSYSLVMKPPFILPNFPVIDISQGKTELIKRGETFDDIFHTFMI